MGTPFPHSDAASRRAPLGYAFLALIAVVVVGLLSTGPATAQTTVELDANRAEQDDVRAQLAEQNEAVNALIGEVSVLREREAAVASELAAQEQLLAETEADLDGAHAELIAKREELAASVSELEDVLVAIYKSDRPDMLGMLLDSNSLADMTAETTYLEKIQDYQDGVIDRVRTLRQEAITLVGDLEGKVETISSARDEIAARAESLAASRAALEAREAELASLRAERRDQLQDLIGDEEDLVRALTPPAPEPTASTGTPASPAAPAPTTNGSTATLNSDGTASAPADAPQAVKDAIAAANAISDSPYVWGGGHGSFESSGYDCSGAVSYALHGGGFLDMPLDSTGFMTWGDSGPGNWITVYSNPGHAYIVIAGLRFDTSGGAGPRWQAPRDPAGFVATHPPGY